MALRATNLVQALFGIALLTAGLGGMGGLMFVTYGESASCQAWALRLGLTLSLLLSAAAQILVLLGGWLLSRSATR